MSIRTISANAMNKTVLYQAYTRRFGTSQKVQITENDLRKFFNEIGIKNDDICHRLFEVMDKDDAGAVGFKDTCHFCSALSGGNLNDKSNFIFLACDTKRTGRIDKTDLRAMLKSLIMACHEALPSFSIISNEKDVELTNGLDLDMLCQYRANQLTRDLFSACDTKKTGQISQKDFTFFMVRGGKTQNEIGELFPFFDILMTPVE